MIVALFLDSSILIIYALWLVLCVDGLYLIFVAFLEEESVPSLQELKYFKIASLEIIFTFQIMYDIFLKGISFIFSLDNVCIL